MMYFCALFTLCILALFHPSSWAEDPMVAMSRNSGDAVLSGYSSSHALLIEQSDYPPGPWDDLESIPREHDRLETLLREDGVRTVTRVRNAGLSELRVAFEKFIADHGFEKDARLIVFYSGHGYTTPDGKAYLVPSTSADPRKDIAQFKRETLDMNQVASWARQMDAKHVLFIFDSCFSGSIFAQRGPRDLPPWITKLTTEPVRYFITAGSANEQVPAESVLVPNMIRGLRYGLADFNKDGFVTSGELGVYLRETIITTGLQTPQHGPLREPRFDGGDVVFRVPNPAMLAVEPSGSITGQLFVTGAPVTSPNTLAVPPLQKADSATSQNGVTGGALGLDGVEAGTASVIKSTSEATSPPQTKDAPTPSTSKTTALITNTTAESVVKSPAPLNLTIPKEEVSSAVPNSTGATNDTPDTTIGITAPVPPNAIEESTNPASTTAGPTPSHADTRGTDQPITGGIVQSDIPNNPDPTPTKSYTKWILGALAVGAVAALFGGGGGGGGDGDPSTSGAPTATSGTVNVVVSVPTN